MTKLLLVVLVSSSWLGCEEDKTEEPTTTTDNSGGTVASTDDIRVFIFGNSLVVHEVTPEPTEEKKVPHWLALLASEGGVEFSVDGRYGFMRDYANFEDLEPQWQFDNAQSEWTDESVSFSQVDFNRIIYTPTNFVQWQAATEPYFDDPNTTPLSTTLSTFDQTAAAHPDLPIYIYAGWADMDGYGTFPGSVNLDNYYEDALGDYHDWFIDYHDRLIAARPNLTIKMIPVNTILTKIFTNYLTEMTISERYEDDAPHGQPTLYFIASLITYSALYQTTAPSTFTIPTTVHSAVRSNYQTIVDFVWDELEAFDHSDGTSRVF